MTTSLPAQECLIKIFRDATEPREAEEQRVLLLNELNHRVKNTLATVHAVVDQTLRAGGVDPALRRDLAGRFRALSKSHDILVSDSWAGADLKSLICEVITPYEQDVSPFVLDGPLVRLHPAQAVSLSLAVHELTTNAVKYGALSVPGGRIQVGWNIGHDGHGARHLSLFWEKAEGRSCRRQRARDLAPSSSVKRSAPRMAVAPRPCTGPAACNASCCFRFRTNLRPP